MGSPSDIDDFLSLKSFAVNPLAHEIEKDPCYPTLGDLPEKVDGAVIVVPPEEAERAVRAAIATGIRAVWMQPGAESEEAIRACVENGLSTIHNACVLVELRRAFSSGGLER